MQVRIGRQPIQVRIGENTAAAQAAAARTEAAEAGVSGTVATITGLVASFGTGALPSVDRIPLHVVGTDVTLWLEGGKLAVAGLSDSLIALIEASMKFGSSTAVVDASYIPLAVVGSDVCVWLDGGKLAAAGLADSLIATIVSSLAASGSVATAGSVPSRGQTLIRTDGRSLRRFARKRAAFKAGAAAVLTVAQIGDSWTGFASIPKALATLLGADMALSAPGWISIGERSVPANRANAGGPAALPTTTGWTLFDMAPSSTTSTPTRSMGPDGYAIYATGTSATLSVTTGIACTSIAIYYWNGNGTFRYRVDGGAWTAVAGTSANAKSKVTITGLSNAAHTVDIDLTGNAGTVELYGFNALRPSTSGVVLHQIGNGSSAGRDWTGNKAHLTYWGTELGIETAFIMLGTNDYRLSVGAPSLTTGLADIAAELCPTADKVLITPAQCSVSGPPSPAQSVYRDATLALAATNLWEVVNLHDEWASYAVESAAGSWADTLHVAYDTDANGSARRIASSMFAVLPA